MKYFKSKSMGRHILRTPGAFKILKYQIFTENFKC